MFNKLLVLILLITHAILFLIGYSSIYMISHQTISILDGPTYGSGIDIFSNVNMSEICGSKCNKLIIYCENRYSCNKQLCELFNNAMVSQIMIEPYDYKCDNKIIEPNLFVIFIAMFVILLFIISLLFVYFKKLELSNILILIIIF